LEVIDRGVRISDFGFLSDFGGRVSDFQDLPREPPPQHHIPTSSNNRISLIGAFRLPLSKNPGTCAGFSPLTSDTRSIWARFLNMSDSPTRPVHTTFWRWLAAGLAAVWLVFASFVLLSCSTVTRTVIAPPDIPGAEFAGTAACVDCHGAIHDHFGASPHERIRIGRADLAGGVGCESCHGPASKHIASGGLREFIINPRRNPSACFQCHFSSHAEFRLPTGIPCLKAS
jgi:hypothetical protein